MPPSDKTSTDAERTRLNRLRQNVKDARLKLRDIKTSAQKLWRESLDSQDAKLQSDLLSKIKKS